MKHPDSPDTAVPTTALEFADALGLLLTDASWAIEKHDDPRLADAMTRCLLRWRDDPAVSLAAARAMGSVSFVHDRLTDLRRALTRAAIVAWRATPDPDERVDVLTRHAERAMEFDDEAEACELYAVAVRECEASVTDDHDRRLVVLVHLLFEQQNAMDAYEPSENDRPAHLRDQIAAAGLLVRTCRRFTADDPVRYESRMASAHLAMAHAQEAARERRAAIDSIEAALRCFREIEARQPMSAQSIARHHHALRLLTVLLRGEGDDSLEEWERVWNAWLRDAAAQAPERLTPGEQLRLADMLWERNLRDEAISVSVTATDRMSRSGVDDPSTSGALTSALFRLGDRLHLAGRRGEAAGVWRRFIDAERRRGRADDDGTVVDGLHRVIRRAVALDDTTLALEFDAILVEELTRLATATDPATFGPELVNALRAHADRLQVAARSAEAADTAERAVAWATRLARAPHHRPLLAEALTTATFHHAKSHRARDADQYSRRALGVFESLTETDPDGYGPGLANALHNRAVTLGQLEDNATARAVNARALDMYRELVGEHPDLRGSQANALCTHAAILTDLHENEAAVGCARQAVDIYTELDESDADADSLPDLCNAHTLAASILGGLERNEDARQAGFAALAVSQRLPDGDRRDDARRDALHAVVTSHIDSGHAQAVVTHSAELVALWERKAERDPTAAEPEFAVALDNHSLCLTRVGRPRDALGYARRSLTLLRRLAESEPGRFRHRLADALDSVALRLRELQRPQEALPLSSEALALSDELLADDRGSQLARTMGIVHHHASTLDDLDRHVEALPLAERGIAIAEELVAFNRRRYLNKLVASLLNQSCRLNDLGRHHEAERVTVRGVALAEELYEFDPEAHREDLAKILHNHANALCQQERYEEALPQLQRAADLGERELEHHRFPGLRLLSITLVLLAGLHLRLEQRSPAEQRTRQAIRVWRELAEHDPALRLPGLADALCGLSREWSDASGWGLTVEITSEGVDVCERLAETDPIGYWPQVALMAERLCLALTDRGDRDGAFAAADRALAARHAAIRAEAADAQVRLARTEVWLARRWPRLDELTTARRQLDEGTRRFRDLIAAGRDELRVDLAGAHHQFGIALGDNGFRTEALIPITEALSMVRRLAAEDRTAHLKRLGEVLWDHAWFLSEAGQPHKAVRSAREALSVVAERVADGDDDLRWEHANAHDLFAKCLGEIGAVAESLEHSATALARWESMAETDEEHRLDLAWSLRHRARVLVERDGPTPSHLALSRRALDIYSDRVTKHPDEKPDLAGTLVDHLRHLDRGGLPVGDDWERAIALWEELAAERPRVHGPGLADCLHRHAEHLLRRGRGELDRALAVYPRPHADGRDPYADRIAEAMATRRHLTLSPMPQVDLLPMSRKDGGPRTERGPRPALPRPGPRDNPEIGSPP